MSLKPFTEYITLMTGQTKTDNMTWTFPKFLDLLNNETPKEFYTDYSVFPEEENGSMFKLKMIFLGRNNDVIEIYYLTPNTVFVKTVLSISLRRCEERSLVENIYNKIEANKWQYLFTLFKRDLTDFHQRDRYLLDNGKLQLKCEFNVRTDFEVTQINIPQADLSNDIEGLLNNGLFSDVVIKSIEGKEYKVHKAILASRSIVLKAHFEHNTVECHTNIVESPFESLILFEVLMFIYSNKVPRIDEIPEKLLPAADFYQLGRLKSLCEEALHKRLTVDNVLETLQLAELHSAKLLKQLTLEFIRDGHAKFIIKTEGWAKEKSVEVIKSIYEFIMNDDMV